MKSARTNRTGERKDQPGSLWEAERRLSPPTCEAAAGWHEEGLEAVFYDGAPWRGQPTKVFAWLGLPARAAGERCPGMVLVHGGGGTAFANWVRLWTGRGYAAIAMDTCGCVPRGQYSAWEHHAAGGPPGWGGFETAAEPPAEQWPFHAIAAVLRGHALLAARPEVDPARIGITGISWGGFLTCIAAGVDPRLRCAVPVYGCGLLGANSCWKNTVFRALRPALRRRWLDLWDPSVYLPRARQPMLWVTGTNDFAYPLDSLQRSYRLPRGPRTLCIRVEMPHGHGPPGENPEEIRVFADQHLRGGPALPRIRAVHQQGRRMTVQFAAATSPVVRAELTFTRATGYWEDRKWRTQPATLDAAAGLATADVPAEATVYYLNLFDAAERVVSTEHIECRPSPSPA